MTRKKKVVEKSTYEETEILDPPIEAESVEAVAVQATDDLLVPVIQVKVKSPMELWLELAPETTIDLTQRWYGEVFVPMYKKWLKEGLLLAQQQT